MGRQEELQLRFQAALHEESEALKRAMKAPLEERGAAMQAAERWRAERIELARQLAGAPPGDEAETP